VVVDGGVTAAGSSADRPAQVTNEGVTDPLLTSATTDSPEPAAVAPSSPSPSPPSATTDSPQPATIAVPADDVEC
jgi:hypothetical protein